MSKELISVVIFKNSVIIITPILISPGVFLIFSMTGKALVIFPRFPGAVGTLYNWNKPENIMKEVLFHAIQLRQGHNRVSRYNTQV